MFTRYNYDDSRTEKKLQQSTYAGRYQINAPGNGPTPFYFSNPYIRLQTWGGNLCNNSIDLESELKGYTHPLCKNTVYDTPQYTFHKEEHPRLWAPIDDCQKMQTDESRATVPAWTFRDANQSQTQYLPMNPQDAAIIPFETNVQNRILEKEYYKQQAPRQLNIPQLVSRNQQS
jgi:hypothetical protein